MPTLIKCKNCGIETYYHHNGLCRDSIKDGGNNCYEKEYRSHPETRKPRMKKSYDGSLVK
jgi:hypothetical protein